MAQYKLYPTRKIHNLREMLEESASLYGGNPAFLQKIDGSYKAFSFVRFKNEVFALGTALIHRSFAGRKIIVMGENCYAWCLSYMTTVCGLGVVVPVDKEIPAEEIANIARISEAALILYSPKYEKKLACVDPSVCRISFDEIPALIEEGSNLLSDGDNRYAEQSIDIDALCSLIFTSGTTGVSKGVMLSQRNICHTIENLARMVYVDTEDRALSVLPLHHVYECTCGFLFPLFCGASVAFSEGVRYIMRNLKEVRPTKMLCVPLLIETMYRKIWSNIRKKGIEKKVRNVIAATNKVQPYSARMAIKKKFFREIHESFGGRLDLLVSGGAPINPEVIRGMRDFGINIIQGYGLTESAPLAAVNHDSYFSDRSAGLVLPQGELKILDPAEDGTGEICVKGKTVMLGYYKNEEETRRVMVDGWFHTGDLGKIDERGYLSITGRCKNLIVLDNGKNVYPEEIENYVMLIPYVAEVIVKGVKDDNDKTVLLAEVFLNKDKVKEMEKEPDEAQLLTDIRIQTAALPMYKQVTKIKIRDTEFEKTTTKKIRRV